MLNQIGKQIGMSSPVDRVQVKQQLSIYLTSVDTKQLLNMHGII